MSILDQQSFHSSFADIAEAEAKAASIHPDINFINIAAMPYKREAGTTLIGGVDGFNPIPLAGAMSLDQFGIYGAPVGNTPTVDETAAIQSAMNYALNKGRALRGNPMRVYGVTAPLYYGADQAQLTDMTFEALAGSEDNWWSGSYILTLGRGPFTEFKTSKMRVERVYARGKHIAKGGICYNGVGVGQVMYNGADQCLETQVRVGAGTASNAASCTGALFYELAGEEWGFGEGEETGEYLYDLRTAKGLWLNGSDSKFIGGGFARCKESLYLGNFFNADFIGSTFYAGQTHIDPNSLTVYLSAEANRADFSACRFDDGRIEIRNMNNSFRACRFIQFTAVPMIRLVAELEDEDGARLTFTDNMLPGGSAAFESGAGNWVAGPFKGNISGNINAQTGASWRAGDIVNALSNKIVANQYGSLELFQQGQGFVLSDVVDGSRHLITISGGALVITAL